MKRLVCSCGVPGPIARRVVGEHHAKSCPLYPVKPAASLRAVKELYR